MNPFIVIDFSISDSLKTVRKSVLIYETIINSPCMKSVSNNEWREVSRSHSKPMVANTGEGLNFRRHKQ